MFTILARRRTRLRPIRGCHPLPCSLWRRTKSLFALWSRNAIRFHRVTKVRWQCLLRSLLARWVVKRRKVRTRLTLIKASKLLLVKRVQSIAPSLAHWTVFRSTKIPISLPIKPLKNQVKITVPPVSNFPLSEKPQATTKK